jgi:predicted nuclease with TOPRIM domain
MAEDIENHTLRLLQEMRGEMREGFAELRQGQAELRQRLDGVEQRLDGVEQRLDGVERRLGVVEGTLGKVIDAVTEIAKVQEKHSGLLVELVESDRIAGARLNAVEARLGRIENKTVLGLQ